MSPFAVILPELTSWTTHTLEFSTFIFSHAFRTWIRRFLSMYTTLLNICWLTESFAEGTRLPTLRLQVNSNLRGGCWTLCPTHWAILHLLDYLTPNYTKLDQIHPVFFVFLKIEAADENILEQHFGTTAQQKRLNCFMQSSMSSKKLAKPLHEWMTSEDRPNQPSTSRNRDENHADTLRE